MIVALVVIYLLPRIRSLKGLEEMTLLRHADLNLLDDETRESRRDGELIGFDKDRCERFVEILQLPKTVIRETIGGQPEYGYSVIFRDSNAEFDRTAGTDTLTLRSDPSISPSWVIIMISQQDLTLELSGSIDTPEIVTALEGLGFHTRF